MSLKDCVKLVKQLDPEDRDAFNTEFEGLTKGGIPANEAYVEAAEAVMESILNDRNELADLIVEKGGYLEKLTLEHLVNPASYTPGPRGAAADIANISADEFDALLEDVAPKPAKDTPAPKEPKKPASDSMTEDDVATFIRRYPGGKGGLAKAKVTDLRKVAAAINIEGRSKMDKAGLTTALRKWYDNRLMEQLPEPIAEVGIRVGEYTHADSAQRTMITWHGLEDSKRMEANVRAIAKHFGGSAVKKVDMYNGGKTEKGIHFNSWDDLVRFYQHYKGQTPLRTESLLLGGETRTPQVAQDRAPVEQFTRGDKVEIIPDMPGDQAIPGEIMGSVQDTGTGAPGTGPIEYLVKYDDPETGDTVNGEKFDARYLRRPEPPPGSESAKEALKNAAKHGVKGADEALTGLAKLFGGKGKFSSGLSFDEETYAKARPHFKKSLEEFVAAGKSLKEFLQYILENFGEGIKPYLKQFHQDVSDGKLTVKGVNDVQSTTQESAAAGETRPEQADQDDTADAGSAAAGVPGETGVGPAETEGVPNDRIGLPVDSPVDVGEQGDTDVLGDTGEFQPTTSAPGRRDTRRGADTRAAGVPADTPGHRKAKTAAGQTSKRLGLRPTTDTWVQSDPTNIAESLPALLPEQQDDVAFAERRLFDNNHRGVMFTNGTGTGKTFTGLGIAKRMVMQGKDNILIVVPGEKVASDWIKSGKAVQLDITKLTGIKDAGTGVVVTTYANISENDAIVKRDWDLVIHDEAHKLSENMAGTATNALVKSRAITGHPDGMYAYAEAMEPELVEQMRYLNAESRVIVNPGGKMKDKYGDTKSAKYTPELRRLAKDLQIPKYVSATHEELLDAVERFRKKIWRAIGGPEPVLELEKNPYVMDSIIAARLEENDAKLRPVLAEFNRRRTEIHNPNRMALWNARTTKRLDLTATPFAYEKSVDHAEGFLFEYDRRIDQQSRGYNAPNSYQAFMIEHFGYRMRTGKLTEPEGEVDRGLMQRQFNQWLKENGALRGRVLTVDHDYSREFIAIDDLVGTKIDEGWNLIRDRAHDTDHPLSKGYQIMEKKLRRSFNYHARVKMLEAIKARHAVERAKQHMDLGRKVVLFHSRIQGGTMNPFHTFLGASTNDFDNLQEAAAVIDTDKGEDLAQYMAAATEFANEREDLMRLDINTVRPLDLFEQEFGEQLTLYNGTITNKAKRENPDKFNDDDLDIYVIAVQDEGGKEGISLHDATGKNQRVLINLGLPVRPTQAIQIEGRIYRVGQMSNAIFEYFNTGTSFERMTFAEKISERASTAENLALGEQARTLKDSFIDAFEEPSFDAPSEAQGIGGKNVDRANWAATSEFERAKTHYFGTQKTKGKRDQRAGLDYFATPEPLGVKMVEWAGIRPNDSVLEPSAGHGSIGRYFPETANATFVEPSSELMSKLMLRAPGKHREIRFEDLDVGGNKYDAIVMNPPFGAGGKTAIDHLNKAMHHLKNGGRIVALIPEGPAADKKFDNMFYGKEGELEQLREAVKRKRKEGGSIAEETRRIDDLTNFHLRANISLPSITFTRAGTAIQSRIVVIDKVTNGSANLVSQPPRDVFADTIKELFDKIEGMTVPERTKLEDSPEAYLAKEGLIVIHDEANGVWRLSGKTFEHRFIIARTLGENAQYSAGVWTATIDPIEPLYEAMSNPQATAEAQPEKPTQADVQAAAAALFSGRAGKLPDAGPVSPMDGLHVTETKDKRGKVIWEVTGNTKKHKDMLKQLGGRWYNPKQAWTFRAGDPTAAIAEALRKPLAMRQALPKEWTPAVNKASTLYSGVPSISLQMDAAAAAKQGKTPAEWLAGLEASPPDPSVYKVGYEPPRALRGAGGASVRQVKGWLKTPLKRISSRVPIEIVKSTDQILTTLPLAPDAMGFYFNGKVALIAENIRTPRDAEIALTHEAVGHLGLEGVLGRRKTNELVGDIVNMKVEEMLKPGTYPQLARILGTLREAYIDEKGAYNLNPKEEALEVIAHIAQSKPRIGPFVEIYNKIMLWLKQQLARWGFGDPNMLKIEEALVRAVDFVTTPPAHYTGEGADGVANMRVYHISDKEFGTFDLDQAAASKGTGTMDYGFGHYFASTDAAAEYYEKMFALEGRPETYRYEAFITPKANELVQWQEPYGQQSQAVQGAFSMLLEKSPSELAAERVTGGALYRRAEREIKQGNALGERIKDIARTRGVDVDSMAPDRVVSTALRQLGARGVQYTGRAGGRNYVVFTDEDAVVLNRRKTSEIKQRKPLASRKPPDKEQMSDAEREHFRKLGLEPKPGLWDKVSDLRTANIAEAFDKSIGRHYEGLFDGLIDIKRYEEKGGVGLGENDYENSAYISARLATGIADMMTHILHYGPLRWDQGVAAGMENTRGLLEVMADLGPKQINDWLMWMSANRSKELMKEGRERNLSEEDIQRGLDKAKGREELFTRIKDEYAAMNRAALDFAEEAGLIDPVKRAEWESQWYVPYYRQSEDELLAPRLKRGLSHQEAGIRRLFGAELPTADLLENIITNWLKLTDASVKNHALRLMIDNFEGKQLDNGLEYITSETMRFKKVLVPKSEIRKRVVADRAFAKQIAEFLGMPDTANNLEVIYELNKVPAAGFEELWAVTAPKDPDVVRVKRNGKNEYWRINIPGLLRAVGHMSPRDWQSAPGMRAGRWFKRLLTTGVTLSPDFMLRNFIRDAAHAWAINPDNMFFAVDSFKGLKAALDEDPIYQAMMASGASFQGGYVHGTDPEASAQIIRRELEKRKLTDDAIHAHLGSIVNTPGKLKAAGWQYWQNYREVGDKIENANRIATAKAALASGKPMAQAMYESKDLMDYSRRGNYGLLIFMTDLMAFLNARMQGADKLRRSGQSYKKIVAMKMAKLIAFSVVLAMWNDDEERYKELQDWDKDAYWHLFPGGQHIRIPKPFEIGILAGTLPERAYRAWVSKSQPSEKFLWSVRHNLMETLNINYGIPQIFLPAVEVAMNRSLYFDQPIESLSDRGPQGVLPKERHNAFTSNTAMELGDTALAEFMGMSPKQIQHLWNGYTGTMGAYALKLSDMVVRGASDEHVGRESIKAHDLPIIRSVYQGTRVKGTQWATDFYDRMEEVRQLHNTMHSYRKQGKLDKAISFRTEHAEKLKMRRRMESAQRMFSQLRTRRDRIMRDPDLTGQQKYQQMQSIQMQINALAKRIEAETRPAFSD